MKKFLNTILRIFGIKIFHMTKININDDFKVVKIENAVFKTTSLKGARMFTEGEMLSGFSYYIKVMLHNDKFVVYYKDNNEREDDFKKLSNLMEGKLKVKNL